MREVQKRQFQFGQVAIEDIWLDPKSRDDIPAVLKGLQHLYKEQREELFSLLEAHIRPGIGSQGGASGHGPVADSGAGRVLKQGLGCDFDRLHDLATNHRTVRAMLAHGDFADDSRYELQTLIDNVSLLTPELLSAVGQLVVESGHAVARKKPGEPLRGRCDSFAVETDVHYPTDVSLLWDAMRRLIRETARTGGLHEVGGWRQWRHLSRGVKGLFDGVRSTRRAKGRPERVEAYLARCGELVERAAETLGALAGKGVSASELASIRGYVGHARRQMDQVERRLLKGETIAHEEKVFSIFEGHTRWVSKGKAGTAVELGVPVCVMEDQFQFILHHKILWAGERCGPGGADGGGDASPSPGPARVQLRSRFSQPGEPRPSRRVARLERAAAQGTAEPGRARTRVGPGVFATARRQHPAVESAINALEHRGLDRVRTRGADGFARTVALSVLAANLHRLGQLLRQRERKQRRRAA